MLEELHVHKVECMYHMYVLGITGDCDDHAVASEANWKWGGLDISENFQQGKNRGDGYGYVLLCKTNGGGGGFQRLWWLIIPLNFHKIHHYQVFQYTCMYGWTCNDWLTYKILI